MRARTWRRRAAGEQLREQPRSLGNDLADHAQTEGIKRLEWRTERERALRDAQRCCCWDVLVLAPIRLLEAFGRHVWGVWLVPPLDWLVTLLLRVLSMQMDAFSVLFIALEEDVRYNATNFSHSDLHISHMLAQLGQRNFDGKTVATPDHDVLWIILFYSPRSKIGGDLKMEALKSELKGMKLSQLLKRARAVRVSDEHLKEASDFNKRRSSWCPCARVTAKRGTQEHEEEKALRTQVISYIVRATYKRSGLQAVQRFNNAARHFDAALTQNPANSQTRIPWPECPAYEGRQVRLGVVNVDDVMSSNDELAINMGVSSADPRFMLLDGDNVPTMIDEEHIDEMLAYSSSFWNLDEFGTAPANNGKDTMRALERMLQLVAEDRRERNVVQTGAVHALIEKTATIDGAIQSYIAKYSNRQALLRCAQHILHGSSISAAGAIQTVLISGVLALLIFTGLGHFIMDPGWISETIICDQVSKADNDGIYEEWKPPLNSDSVVDSWSCGLACQGQNNATDAHTLFKFADECTCGTQSSVLDQFVNLYPQCFDEGAIVGGGERISQLLHAKLIILRYWDVQLCRYVLQIAVPASFCLISVLRIFARLPPLKDIKSLWTPWFITSLFFTVPIVLMYFPSFLVTMSTDGIRTISLSGAHLYVAVLALMPMILLGVGIWYLSYYCARDNKDFPISRYHCVWSLVFMIHLVLGSRIALWSELEIYGDENWDLGMLFNKTANVNEATGFWMAWYEDNTGVWAAYFKTGSILGLGLMSSQVATLCTKADCLAVETREQLKNIAADAERRRELEAHKTCKDRLISMCCGDEDDKMPRIREKEVTNKWASGNLTPDVELTVVPAPNKHCPDPHNMSPEQLHDFEASIELLLNIKLAWGRKKHNYKIAASIDAYLL